MQRREYKENKHKTNVIHNNNGVEAVIKGFKLLINISLIISANWRKRKKKVFLVKRREGRKGGGGGNTKKGRIKENKYVKNKHKTNDSQ